MNSIKKVGILATVTLLFSSLSPTPQHGSEQRSNLKVVTLQSSDRVFDGDQLRALTAISGGRRFYGLRVDTGNVAVYDQEHRRLKEITPAREADALTADLQDRVYLANTENNKIHVFGPTGERLGTFPVGRPASLATLSNGNIVVASAGAGHLISIHDSDGKVLARFGEIKKLDGGNVQENNFLNRGKLAIGPSDTIYYVSRFAPKPFVQKFSSGGQLLAEFVVEGSAVDYQVNVANDFLREKSAKTIGGVHVLTSASVDPKTGHLWIGMNGTSRTGIVYEYGENGEKLAEYSFLLKVPNRNPIITGVKDLVVREPWIYLLTWDNEVYRFNLNATAELAAKDNRKEGWASKVARWMPFRYEHLASPTSAPLMPQLPCPSEQPLTCVANCRSGTNPVTQNCGDEVRKRLATGDIIIGSSCNNNPGPEPSCSAQASTCNTGTGVRASITLSLTCNAPRTDADGDNFSLEEDPQDCNDEDAQIYPGAPTMCEAMDRNCNNIDDRSEPTAEFCGSPILIDVAGNGFDLTDNASGVLFGLKGSDMVERWSWTVGSSDDAWLALDRNNNGAIDSGFELFGSVAQQPRSLNPHGYKALAEYDKPANGGNGDGAISSSDAIYPSLRLWQDSNHNGYSEPQELRSLSSANIESISLNYLESRQRDRFGNVFRYRAKIYGAGHADLGRWAYDVFLLPTKP